jgi:hypothetical protein
MRTHGSIGRYSVDVNIIKDYIFSSNEECSPAWRVFEVEARNLNVCSVVCQKQNRTKVFVVRVKDLSTRKAIPPGLSVAVDHSRAIDLDVPRV